MATSDGGPNWEAIARKRLKCLCQRTGSNVHGAFSLLAQTFQSDGTPSREEFVDARAALTDAIHTLEDDIAPAIEGVESAGAGADYMLTSGDAADHLDLTIDQVNELNDGVLLELDGTATDELANGHTVCLETDAGTSVVLQPETADCGEGER